MIPPNRPNWPGNRLEQEDPDLAALEAELTRSVLRDSFADFVQAAWPIVEPTRALMPSVAIDALCAVLQEAAVSGGRWAIACPPGVSKSLVTTVLWPAYLLLRSKGQARIMAGSYSWELGARDSIRCRALLESPFMRDLVAGEWAIRSDADRRDDFWTTTSGRRMVTSTGAKATGERARFQILDDVLSATDAASPAKLKEAAFWVTQVMPSRLEDTERDCRVIVGQRLGVADPLGVVLEQGGWRYLKLPATATDQPCELVRADGSVIWRDPRAPGEPLVDLLSTEALERLKLELGSAAFASQYMQEPRDDSMAAIRRQWWSFHKPAHVSASAPRPPGCDEERPAVDTPSHFTAKVISVDLTFGSATGDFAVATVWGAQGGGRYLLDMWRARAGLEESLAAITRLAGDHPGAKVLIERAAHGHAVLEVLRKQLPGVIAVKPIGSKAQRLGAISPTVESGSCFLPLGAPWLEHFVEEMAGATKWDDIQDASSYGIHELATRGAHRLRSASPISDASYARNPEPKPGAKRPPAYIGGMSSSSSSSSPWARVEYLPGHGPKKGTP